jgi:hypothetical protein
MTEIKRLVDSIAKRKYPETEQEKNCIEKYGKLIIKRGHFSKALINFISKYDSEGKTEVLDSGTEQTDTNHQIVQG